jgi:microcystin degradation protein MlrC
MRIGVVGFYHETNTFALEQNDKLDADVRFGEDVFLKAQKKSFIEGFKDKAMEKNLELIPVIDIHFTHGGLIRKDVYEYYRKTILDHLKNTKPLNAIYFGFHGAAVAESPYHDAEGEILREVRKDFPGIPFIGTYDFHAIMSEWEVDNITPFPYNTNPHIDAYERGIEAAELLPKMLKKEVNPISKIMHIPIIGPNIGQSTWSHIPEEEKKLPLYQLNLQREELEKIDGVINVTILGGYGYADTKDSCMSVIVTTDGNPELAGKVLEEMANAVWAKREGILSVRPIYSLDEGVLEAINSDGSPVILVDLGDDPGSSSSADSPAVLESLIKNKARDCALTIRDPEVVDAGIKAGVGAELEMLVGAKIDQRFYKPIKVKGIVKTIDDGSYTIYGPTHGGWGKDVNPNAFRDENVGKRVVLRLEGKIDVIFSINRTGKDRDFFKSIGINPQDKKIIVVKSNQGHRASFDPIAAKTIDLNTPGTSSIDYLNLPFKHIKRPLWPIDRNFQFNG